VTIDYAMLSFQNLVDPFCLPIYLGGKVDNNFTSMPRSSKNLFQNLDDIFKVAMILVNMIPKKIVLLSPITILVQEME
jgi:hypothetical protein